MTARALVTSGVLLLAALACRSETKQSRGTPSARPKASANGVASSKLTVVKAPPVASADWSRAPGPVAAGSAARDVRETAVLALLGDPGLARRAPLVDLEPGREFDWTLRDRIAPALLTPVARVRLIETTVDGDLSDAVAQRIIRQNHGRFRMCYERGLAKTPKLEGRVKIAFSVEPDGSVKSARDGGSKLADASVARCIIDTMVGLRFPSTSGGLNIVQTVELFAP